MNIIYVADKFRSVTMQKKKQCDIDIIIIYLHRFPNYFVGTYNTNTIKIPVQIVYFLLCLSPLKVNTHRV